MLTRLPNVMQAPPPRALLCLLLNRTASASRRASLGLHQACTGRALASHTADMQQSGASAPQATSQGSVQQLEEQQQLQQEQQQQQQQGEGQLEPLRGGYNPPSRKTTPVAVQIPPPPDFYGLGARVEHMLAPREGQLSVLVAETLQLSQPFAEALIAFGAIYTCPVPPTAPPEVEAGLPAGQVEGMRRAREAAALASERTASREGKNANHMLSKPQRASEDTVVAANSYIRIHVHPKRFPAAYAVLWEDRILSDEQEFVVVNKPAGVPVAPTVDNILECVPTLAAKAVGHPTPLLITHRLDQCTEGVLVLGKTTAFVSAFNALLKREGGVLRKFYRALTAQPPPQGPLLHHLSMQKRRAGLPSHTIVHEEPREDSMPCELRVLGVERVQLTGAAAQRWGPSAYECLIELVTGRTHQIRAQLSAVGCPLLGDELYTPLASRELRQRLHSSDPTLEVVNAQGQRLLSEPVGGIGLQACRLVVELGGLMGRRDGSADEYEAGVPWWRAGQQ